MSGLKDVLRVMFLGLLVLYLLFEGTIANYIGEKLWNYLPNWSSLLTFVVITVAVLAALVLYVRAKEKRR